MSNDAANTRSKPITYLEAEATVKEYLDSFASIQNPSAQQIPRVACCKPSQSLYCKDCCRLLVPDEALPLPILHRKQILMDNESTRNANDGLQRGENQTKKRYTERPLRLPFNLHVILDDRRGSSTGIHAIALLGNHLCNNIEQELEMHEDKESNGKACRNSCTLGTATLTDVEKLDPTEQSEVLENALEMYDESISDDSSTYFLFPCPGESVPLEEVSDKVKTLIVLDCKWTKSGVWRRSDRLRRIPKVHLSNPPKVSHFWRWHNAGPGMMSTIEAIYYASLEVYRSRYSQLQICFSPQSQMDECLADEDNLIHLLWLFGQQRLATMEKARCEGKAAPCCEDGKEFQRSLRRRKISWRPK
jgi:hypothetical protein